MNRKRYQRLYKLKSVIDPQSGKEKKVAEYTGDYYAFGSEGKKEALLLLPWTALAFAAYIAAGMLNTPSSRCFYVMPFYAFTLLPLVYLIMGTGGLFFAPQKMTEIKKEDTVDRIRHSAYGALVLSVLTMVGDLCFCLFGQGVWAQELWFMLFIGLIVLFVFLHIKKSRKWVCVKE